MLKPFKSLKKIKKLMKSSGEWYKILKPGMAKHYRLMGEYIKERKNLEIEPFKFESLYETSYRLRGLVMHIMGSHDLLNYEGYKKIVRKSDRPHIKSMWDDKLCRTYLHIADSLDNLTMDQIIDLRICQK